MRASIPRLSPRLAERLARKKALLDGYRPLPADVVQRLNADLRVLLTYHSNAIEGNTLSLRETQMVIDYGLTVHGHPLREYLEATNHAAAYDYVTELVTRPLPLTRDSILALHGLVMNTILPTSGAFRVVPVFIRGANMTPPPPEQVEELMRQWVAWLDNEGMTYEPVLRSAIAHHGFEAVHPFVDGNGRVGRLLLNLMLMRDGYPPALMLREWRVRYITALDTANTGNYTPLANLIGQAVEAGFDRYLAACAVQTSEPYLSLAALAKSTEYSTDYLGWLVRQGRLPAVKRGGRWYSTLADVQRYQQEVSDGHFPAGRPPKKGQTAHEDDVHSVE